MEAVSEKCKIKFDGETPQIVVPNNDYALAALFEESQANEVFFMPVDFPDGQMIIQLQDESYTEQFVEDLNYNIG
ncbi:hypothetical protein WAF17_10645 [Bernardetia sp. ABR2-2B]|uniref:hypothetical protein n=1 Tax=Bernardetia sp. ABR2-2B TaxID=3127472 RepID=UPI0030D1959E